ncbi:hypothetical protein F4818DRAFT_446820 [Hypoxylon cercidicola]|nr:hypothetical protein F4818DRAFT_446820 [Hypoxylon cercidicola]
MQTVGYGRPSLTPEQHLLSPNSAGNPNGHLCPPRRYLSHSCKSAPAERYRKENSREYEGEHWLFSNQPQRYNKRGFEDELISIWLSGISCSNSPNEETNLTGLNTSDSLRDVGDTAGTLPTFLLTTFDKPLARCNLPTAQSGTGLDGPLSSEGDKLSKMLRDGLRDLKESTCSADLSTNSRKSNASGSIDWEKNWEKRKPRRKHDVSEVADLEFTLYTRPADLSSAVGGNDSCSVSEDESDGKSCSYLSQHDTQLYVIKRHANSCPELHHQLDEFDTSFAMFKTRDSKQPTSQVRFDLGKDRHRHQFRVRNIITKQFRSIGRRIQRTGSSTFSIRSEFRAPPDSKERRLLARDSADIWPSSGEETPLFNTPESDINLVRIVGHHLDPLAMASMMIATAELDRLSSRASLDQASRTSGSSTGFYASPISPTSPYSGSASPNNGISLANSTTLEIPPTIPLDTPTSSGPQSGVATPLSRSSQRRGRRRRAQRSHLSEVTTPDEIPSPADPAEDFGEQSRNEHSPYHKPLAIYRGGHEETGPRDDTPSEDNRENSIPSVSITPPEKSGGRLRSPSGLSDTEAISPPSRVSSIRKTPESMYGPKTTGYFHFEELGSASASGNGAPARQIQTVSEETVDDSGGHTAAGSCHTCTWFGSHSEPGNSDPFCLPDSLETAYSSREGHCRFSGLMREGSVDTVYTVVIGKRAESKSDEASEGGT